ncbi:hypothetical protein QR685DRAFT_425990, partial [Neurospora intermedia]
RGGKASQVEWSCVDDESVLSPLLNAPCFGCKNSDSAITGDPSSGDSSPQNRDVVSRGWPKPPQPLSRVRKANRPFTHPSMFPTTV